MLDELSIRGLGVIEETVLPLGPGLTVITGETGAGKTMVVTGLLLLFGGRADPARVRAGSAQASVEGRLLLAPQGVAADLVRAAGGELDELADDRADGAGHREHAEYGEHDAGGPAELVLRRVVAGSGRSRAYAGGASVPAATLSDLAEHLLVVHGQSDQLRLTRPGAQREALDRYAGIDVTAFSAAFASWRDAERELAERTSRAAELRRETDLLTFGIGEIETAAPAADESDELTRLAARLGHAESLTLAARGAHDLLLGDADDPSGETADVVSLLGAATRTLLQQAGDDPGLDELAGRLGELAALAGQLGSDLRDYGDGLDADPARLEQIEARRAVLAGLVRKYGDGPDPNLAAVHRWAQDARDRLSRIDVSDEALAQLRARRERSAAAVAQLALELTRARRDAAGRLADAVSAELRGLAMSGARLDVTVRPRAASAAGPTLLLAPDADNPTRNAGGSHDGGSDAGGSDAGGSHAGGSHAGGAHAGDTVGVGPDGADEVAFLLRPHPDAPALPLAKGASGGELSRIMLALEVCLAATGSVPTLVFDEVDAGVGGRAAVEVGRRLARLGRDRQVLVVTHLPQVAAYADRHVVVGRPGAGAGAGAGDGGGAGAGRGVGASDVRVVTSGERVSELARMLAGSDTATAREHAVELLATAAAQRTDRPPADPHS